jgi:hypothetical protein
MESQSAPSDGMEDAGFYFDELAEQVGAWSQKNFGDQLPHRPLLGIVEELSELDDALHDFDVEQTEDAIADAIIYMADYHHRRGWKFSATWKGRHLVTPASGMTTYLVRSLAHSHLKSEQNIRGGSAVQDEKVKEACSAALGYLERVAAFMDQDLCAVIQKTWEVVSKRDWTKNPNNAHQVAADSGGLVPVSEP